MNNYVTIVEDDSVTKLIERKSKKLLKKYNKSRSSKYEKHLHQSKPKKVISIILDVLLAFLIVCSVLFLMSGVLARINKTVPVFMGYTAAQVATPSMTLNTIEIDGKTYPSGFPEGSTFVVKPVDAHTLSVGDKIAFFRYNYKTYDNVKNFKNVSNETNTIKYNPSFGQLFGFQNSHITEASRATSRVYFHHIVEIFEDNNGERWFVTRGSTTKQGGEFVAPEFNDVEVINEKYIVGAYVDSDLAMFTSKILKFLSTSIGLLVIVAIPFVLLISLFVISGFRDVALIKLELDCVEEKRKITDPVCVKNNIGFNMNNKTKYKILAQADEEDVPEYLSLLWKDGSTPNSIKKYYIKKSVLLNYNKKLLLLNRQCEEMLKNNGTPQKIAKHYLKQREIIEKEQRDLVKKLKSLNKKSK